MVKKNIEDDEEDDLIEFVAPVAMDWVKDQHVERLHPKYWLSAARSLQYSADIIFEHERPFTETLHAVAISELDKRQDGPTSLVRASSMHLRSKISSKASLSQEILTSETPPFGAKRQKRISRSEKRGTKEDSTSG
jgi:hypothetical protein